MPFTYHDEIFLGEACKNNDCETISKGIIHQLDGSHKWKKDKNTGTLIETVIVH